MTKRDVLNGKKSLDKARDTKNDEFFTLPQDIVRELDHYKDQFKGKKVICPCDWDGNNCNFIRVLRQVKKDWGIKSIEYSGFDPSDPKNKKHFSHFRKFEDVNYNKYDIVITNPPFSRWRDFVAKMMQYPHLKFLIVGPLTATTYKEIAKLITANKIWLGYGHMSDFLYFDKKTQQLVSYVETTGWTKLPSTTMWWTNMDVDYRRQRLFLTESYYKNPLLYPKADNMDVIVVDKVKNIPFDYEGLMAVPMSFLNKYNPDQFQILNVSRYYLHGFKQACDLKINGKSTFMKFIIRNKKPVKNKEDQYE